jgi:hypothetical protein
MKTDENVEKVRTSVRTDHCIANRMRAEEMSMDKGMVRQILTTNLNMKEVCQNGPKELPGFSRKTNTSA